MRNKYTLQDCIDWAKQKNGECLSTEYIDTQKKLKWKCNCGNEWEASFSEIKSKNTWCRKCSHKNLTVKIKDIFDYVVNECNKLNIRLPDDNSLIKLKEKINEKHVRKCINV